MAEGVSAAPIDALNVHVTGRRILATVVDGIVVGVLYVVMAALFGHLTRGTLPPLPAVVYAVLATLYYILLEGYLGADRRKDAVGYKGGSGGQWRGSRARGRDHKD